MTTASIGPALILGGTGFVGRHLAARLARAGEVTAVGRTVDVRDRAALDALVARVRPQVVVNLAAITTVRESFLNPRQTFEVNHGGLRNIVDSLAAHGFAGRLLQVSSSEVYGRPAAGEPPLTERSPLRPDSPYAFAKALAEQAALAAPFEVVIARPFTHIGPGQSTRFSIARFANQLAEAARRDGPHVLETGGLAATRDFTDVRDVAAAYEAMLREGRPGAIYNVCTGVETSMQAAVEMLISASGLEVWQAFDPDLSQEADTSRLCGDHGRLTADTGWIPKIALETTLADVLADAMARG